MADFFDAEIRKEIRDNPRMLFTDISLDESVELMVVENTVSIIYVVIPVQLDNIPDQVLSSIQAAAVGSASTLGTASSASTASSVSGCLGSVSTLSSGGCIGTIET